MNPKISIAIDAKNRAVVTTTGMVTVGAKVDVEITGLPSQIPDWAGTDKWYGKSVRFRVVNDAGQDIVRFPLAEKSGASATDGDKWTVVAAAGTAPETYKTSDGTATSPYVEFDTDGLRRKMACVPFCECREFGVIIDSIVDAAEYAVGKIKVRQWAKASTEDPTVLPDWRDTLDALRTDLSAVDASKAAAAASASSAATAATTAGNSATLAGQYADAALVNKDLATSAKNAAEAAQAAAAASKTDAETAQTAAEAAQDAAEEAQSSAEAAASKYPYIDANGHWKVWENGAWVDKGSAKGDKGDTGETGAQGPQGPKGDDGEDGSIVSVSASGTATDEVKYITIDGVEKKLSGGGDMKHSEFSNVTTLANATLNQVSAKVNEIIGLLKTASPIVLVTIWMSAFGDLGPNTPFGDVPPASTLGQVVSAGGGGGGVSTNAVSGIITNHVTSGYLCTVAAADAKYLVKGANAGTQNIGDYYLEPGFSTLNNYGNLYVKKRYSGYGGSLTVEGGITAAAIYLNQGGVLCTGGVSASGDITTAGSLKSGDTSSSASNWSVAEGFQSVASGKLSHAAGFRAKATKDTAFVWQGTTNVNAQTTTTTNFYDHGRGTFNVNPAGGLAGFWIGETNMATHIGNLSYTKSVADARFAPTNVAVAVAGKQDRLVSGTNIKTVNGNSLLGEGNIEIQGGGGIPEKHKVVTLPDNNWEFSPSFAGNTMIEEINASGWNNPFGGASGFANCLGLRKVKYSGTMPGNGKFNNLGALCFVNCTNLTEVDFGGCIFNSKNCGDRMFLNCYNLGRVEFPEGVTGHNNQLFCNFPVIINGVANSCLTNVVFPATWKTFANYVVNFGKDNGVDYTFKADVAQIVFSGSLEFAYMTFKNSTARFPNNTMEQVLAAFTSGTYATKWAYYWYTSGRNNTFICSDGTFTTP